MPTLKQGKYRVMADFSHIAGQDSADHQLRLEGEPQIAVRNPMAAMAVGAGDDGSGDDSSCIGRDGSSVGRHSNNSSIGGGSIMNSYSLWIEHVDYKVYAMVRDAVNGRDIDAFKITVFDSAENQVCCMGK